MTAFEVWAPQAAKVELEVDGAVTVMASAEAAGWWRAEIPGPGTDYSYRIDGGPPRPDPRSRRQPEGVHGPRNLYVLLVTSSP